MKLTIVLSLRYLQLLCPSPLSSVILLQLSFSSNINNSNHKSESIDRIETFAIPKISRKSRFKWQSLAVNFYERQDLTHTHLKMMKLYINHDDSKSSTWVNNTYVFQMKFHTMSQVLINEYRFMVKLHICVKIRRPSWDTRCRHNSNH